MTNQNHSVICYFDNIENVISVEITDIFLTPTYLNALVDNVRSISVSLTTKVYLIMLWKNVTIVGNQDFITKSMSTLLDYVKGIVRYETKEETPFRIIKTKTGSHVFSSKVKSKAAAITTVRLLEENS